MFLKLLNMSISASWLVLAVLILRLLLKKTPKWISCVLWGIVAIRLLLPFTVESRFSLIPSAEVIPQDIVSSQAPAIHSGIPAINSAVNPAVTQQVINGGFDGERLLSIAATVWLCGMVLMIAYGFFSFLQLKWRVRTSVCLRDRTYLCDDVDSPFVFGIFRPRIYMPSGLEDNRIEYILAHEYAHIRRKDHFWKPLSYWLLSVYWFNPLLWLVYVLLCRDIEMACDEKAVSAMDAEQKRGYSQALLECSIHRRMIMACPVAFGEVGVKTRIKGIFSYKKPALWIVIASVAVCTAVAVCFLTNPKTCLHKFDSEILTASTCTQRGIESHTCQVCSYSYTAPVEVCAHTYDQGVVTKEPTCTQSGEMVLTCISCHAQQTQSVEKIPHTDGERIVSVEPNCSQEGEVTTACTYCQAVYVVEILPCNDVHDLQETVTKESTCTEKGEGIKTCSRCEYTEAVEYELKEHSYRTVRTWQPGCHFDGEIVQVCTVCQKVHTIWLPALGPNSGTTNLCYECLYHRSLYNNSGSSNSSRSENKTKPQDELLPSIIWDVDTIMNPKP